MAVFSVAVYAESRSLKKSKYNQKNLTSIVLIRFSIKKTPCIELALFGCDECVAAIDKSDEFCFVAFFIICQSCFGEFFYVF